ncbi:Coiled-coil domain-containing protein 96 [Cichlidogyrus casuarinus]|uniref:Coiled-coil domain-containing protein 96 n=1 Tax=Cichlidogyrus casuarinus TaxID=1844966 RepID=A0ABD2Q224_9PLAT
MDDNIPVDDNSTAEQAASVLDDVEYEDTSMELKLSAIMNSADDVEIKGATAVSDVEDIDKIPASDKQPEDEVQIETKRLSIYQDVEEAERPQLNDADEDLVTMASERSSICSSNQMGSEKSSSEREMDEYERQTLIETYHSTREEIKSMMLQKSQLVIKIHEYFNRRKAKATENEETSSVDPEMTAMSDVKEKDMEQVKLVMNDLRKELQSRKQNFSEQISTLKNQCEQRQVEVLAASKEFTDYRSKIALQSINSRTCQPFSKQELAALLQTEDRKESILAEIRLEFLRLNNVCNKLNKELTNKEQLAGGLQLIDFEQLKIENQTYNEKIEERMEELNKLKRKVTSTVQVTTHLREKLEAVKEQRSKNKEKLDQLDETLSKKRDKLSKMKQLRNRIKSQNEKLEDECGLLIKPNLLKHYGESTEQVKKLKEKQGMMQYQIAHFRMRNKILQERILKTQRKLHKANLFS